jgi:hypothetical protein
MDWAALDAGGNESCLRHDSGLFKPFREMARFARPPEMMKTR